VFSQRHEANLASPTPRLIFTRTTTYGIHKNNKLRGGAIKQDESSGKKAMPGRW